MKRYLIWLWLLIKRLLRKPAFLCLMAAMPVFAIAFVLLERETDDKLAVGIVWEESEAAAETKELETLLTDSVSIFDFRIYDNADALIWAVKGEEIACGFVIPEDIAAHLITRTWEGKIIVYVEKDESIAQIVKEKLAAVLFTIYAEENYVNLIEKAAKGTGIPDREIMDFAMTAYEAHLADGSTFALGYEEIGSRKADLTAVQSMSEGNLTGQNAVSQARSKQSVTMASSLLSLRGILAICVFLCGICGLLTDCKDRQNRRFVRAAPNWVTTMVNIWAPMIPASFTMLISLYMGSYMLHIREPAVGTDDLKIGIEILRLLIYQFLIVLYCSIIRVVLRKRERIAAVIPFLTLGSLICGPVFIRLGLYLPVFHVLEKLFPATWYLLL